MSKEQLFDYSTNLNLNQLCFYDNSNNINIACKYFVKCKDYTDLIKHIMIVMNTNITALKLMNREIKFNVIVDGTEMKINNLDYNFLKMLFPFLDETYPETINKIFIKNMPFIFKAAYKIIRIAINRDTRNKIVFIKNSGNNNIEIDESQYENVF